MKKLSIITVVTLGLNIGAMFAGDLSKIEFTPEAQSNVKTKFTQAEKDALVKMNQKMCDAAGKNPSLLPGLYKRYLGLIKKMHDAGMEVDDIQFKIAKLFEGQDKPIHKAALSGGFDAVKLILKLGRGDSLITGEDIFATKGKDSKTVFHSAAEAQNINVLNELYEFLKNKYEKTLDKAIEETDLSNVEKQQAEEKIVDRIFAKYLNLKDAFGNTPLMYVVSKPWGRANFNLTKYLVNKGADVTLKNNKGKSALELSFFSVNWRSHNYMFKNKGGLIGKLVGQVSDKASGFVEKVATEFIEDPVKFTKKVQTKVQDVKEKFRKPTADSPTSSMREEEQINFPTKPSKEQMDSSTRRRPLPPTRPLPKTPEEGAKLTSGEKIALEKFKERFSNLENVPLLEEAKIIYRMKKGALRNALIEAWDEEADRRGFEIEED